MTMPAYKNAVPDVNGNLWERMRFVIVTAHRVSPMGTEVGVNLWHGIHDLDTMIGNMYLWKVVMDDPLATAEAFDSADPTMSTLTLYSRMRFVLNALEENDRSIPSEQFAKLTSGIHGVAELVRRIRDHARPDMDDHNRVKPLSPDKIRRRIASAERKGGRTK